MRSKTRVPIVRVVLTIAVVLLIVLITPKIISFIQKIIDRLKVTFGFLSGEGNKTSQEIATLKEKAFAALQKSPAANGLTLTAQDFNDAAQIAKWNNSYRGFFQSMISTNVPRSDQIKVMNRLGISVYSDGFIHWANGTKSPQPIEKLAALVLLGPNIAAVANPSSRDRIKRIIMAYGQVTLSDRQRFLVGFVLDNTTGNLLNHIDEFYSAYFVRNYLPLLMTTFE